MRKMKLLTRLIREKKILIMRYEFGDASGLGFGSSWMNKDGAISYRLGIWGIDGTGK